MKKHIVACMYIIYMTVTIHCEAQIADKNTITHLRVIKIKTHADSLHQVILSPYMPYRNYDTPDTPLDIDNADVKPVNSKPPKKSSKEQKQ